jgi:hypothetical protein
MAYLEDMFLEAIDIKYLGEGKFVGKSKSSTCTERCLEFTVNQLNPKFSDKSAAWYGEFFCRKNCPKSKILSNLNMRNHQIFFNTPWFESDPESYNCLFNPEEGKEFLKEEISFLYNVLQKKESEWRKELENHDLRFLGDAIFWMVSDEINNLPWQKNENNSKDINANRRRLDPFFYSKDDDSPF